MSNIDSIIGKYYRELLINSCSGNIPEINRIKNCINLSIKSKKNSIRANNNELKTLECSSKGDKRFSALFCNTNVNGVLDTIEKHYQLSKVFIDLKTNNPIRFNTINKIKQAQYLTNKYSLIGFNVKGKFISLAYMTMWYYSLWYKHFCINKDKINIVKKYDFFTDCFAKPNTMNSQADVMYFIRYNSMQDIRKLITPFLELFD